MAGILYIVATPIGNLGDISARALEILNNVSFIAAEDTRVTLKLLNHFAVKKPLVSYYEHNRKESGEVICARIFAGEDCALVSDAGMPAISDPGEELVKLCAERGIEITVIPGPSAVISALALSGLPTGRFTFEGFLTMNKRNRKEHLAELKTEKRTMIFYEAPHKLKSTLRDLLDVFGDRRVSISRELTKIYEQTLRVTLSEAVAYFEQTVPRGEFVIIVEGASEDRTVSYTISKGAEFVWEYMQKDKLSLKDATRRVAGEYGLSKNELYQYCVNNMKQ